MGCTVAALSAARRDGNSLKVPRTVDHAGGRPPTPNDGAGNQAGSTASTGPGIKSVVYNLQGQTASITPRGSTTPFDICSTPT